jgi:hypothetical protein
MTLRELSNFYDANAYDFKEKLPMLNEAKIVFLKDILAYFAK